MGFRRSTTDISVHQALSDYPNQDDGLSAEQLKERFDFPAETLQDDLNNLEDELEAVTAAIKIGASPMTEDDDSGNNLQAKINKLYEDIQGVVAGAIPDNSITENKLESTYSGSLAKKDGTLQTNLNVEKLGGVKLPVLYANAKYHTPTLTVVSNITTKANYIPTMNSLTQDGFVITYNSLPSGYTEENIYKLFSSSYASRSTEYSFDYGSRYIDIQLKEYAKINSIKMYGAGGSATSSDRRIRVSGSIDGTTWKRLGYVQMQSSDNDGTLNQDGITDEVKNQYYKYLRIQGNNGDDTRAHVKKINFDVDYVSTLDNNRLDVDLLFTSYEDGQKLSIKVPSEYISGGGLLTKIKLGDLEYKQAPDDLQANEYVDLLYDGTKFIRR